MAKKTQEKYLKLWVRLGGNIKVTEAELSAIVNGDGIDEEKIFARGFEVNGDCYAPSEQEEAELDEDAELGELGIFDLFPKKKG